MWVKDILELIKDYSEAYVVSLKEFFSGHPSAEAEIFDQNGALILNAVINVVFGVALSQAFIYSVVPTTSSFFFGFAYEIGFWVSGSLLIWLLMKLFRRAIEFWRVFSAMLRIDPVCFLLASLSTFLVSASSKVAIALPNNAGTGAWAVAALVHTLTLANFLPRALAVAAGEKTWRVTVASGAVVVTLLLGQVVVLTQPPPTTEIAANHQSAPIKHGGN